MGLYHEEVDRANAFEVFVYDFLKPYYPSAVLTSEIIKGKCKRGDILIQDKDLWFECKGQWESIKSGNVALETIDSFNEPAGIMSGSDYFVQCYYHLGTWRVSMIKTNKLVKLVEGRREIKGGTGKKTTMILMSSGEWHYISKKLFYRQNSKWINYLKS